MNTRLKLLWQKLVIRMLKNELHIQIMHNEKLEQEIEDISSENFCLNLRCKEMSKKIENLETQLGI